VQLTLDVTTTRNGHYLMSSSAQQPLRIEHHDSVSAFPKAAADVYQADPVLFNAELTALTGTARPMGWHGTLLSVWDGNAVAGAAVRELGHPLLTSGLSDRAAAYTAEALAADRVTVPGVLGLHSSATVFADRWCSLTGSRPAVCCDEIVYRLADLRAPEQPRGAARPANSKDTDLLVGWLTAFHAEAFGRPVSETSTRAFLAQVWATHSQFIVWEDNAEPISMARVHPPCAGVVRIGPVFTPAPRRGHGAGTAATVAAIRLAQAQGCREIVLQADVTNTTANRIYRRLGFQSIATALQVSFDQ
jgi:predicted GNAT family acetyltransferase